MHAGALFVAPYAAAAVERDEDVTAAIAHIGCGDAAGETLVLVRLVVEPFHAFHHGADLGAQSGEGFVRSVLELEFEIDGILRGAYVRTEADFVG